jgi:hypothetical protein
MIKIKNYRFIIAILLFVLIGILGIVAIKAVTPTTSIEAENGSKNGITPIQDTSASRNSAIQFSKVSAIPFSTYINSVGPLANELNVASNGTWNWINPVNTSGADQYKITMRAPNNLAVDNYFWSSSFVWTNVRNSGGYIGLQSKVFPLNGSRGAIFSIWNTTVAEAASTGISKPFGGEGVGMQTAIPISWAINTDYEMSISRIAARSDSTYNWWVGSLKNLSTGSVQEIGRIRSPVSWGYMVPNNTFLERYGATNSCTQFEQSGGNFKNLQALNNGSTYFPSSVAVEIRRYSDCANVINASSISGGYSVTITPGIRQ